MTAKPEGAATGCLATEEEVGALYAAKAIHVCRVVHLRVSATDAVVEDACQVAWLRLLVHRRRIGRDGAVRWVVSVATHEAIRALARGVRDVSLEEVGGDDGAPITVPELIEELAEQRSRLGAIRCLPSRQQRLVWLQGLGFSYGEMSDQTGETRRTVERQLLRAKRTLARAEAA